MVPKTNQMPLESELVTIRTFTNEPEAYLAKGALEASGIDCMIARDDCGGLRPHLTFTDGLRILVRAEDAELAADVLKNGHRRCVRPILSRAASPRERRPCRRRSVGVLDRTPEH